MIIVPFPQGVDISLVRRDHNFYYLHNNRLYDTDGLMAQSIIVRVEDYIPVFSVRSLVNLLVSNPIIIVTRRYQYIVVTLDNNRMNIVMTSTLESPDPSILFITQINSVPDVMNIVPRRDYQGLPRLNLLSSYRLYRYLIDTHNAGNLSVLGRLNLEQSIPSESDSEEDENMNSLLNTSYENLLKQLYRIPVQLPEFLIINGSRINFISFQMLTQNQIERFDLNPLLQPLAGLPESSNRILTVVDKNDTTYLVKVRYDQTTNQAYPPI